MGSEQLTTARQLEHDQIYPKPGWVEHDPLQIWTRTQEAVHGAMHKLGRSGAHLAQELAEAAGQALGWDKSRREEEVKRALEAVQEG